MCPERMRLSAVVVLSFGFLIGRLAGCLAETVGWLSGSVGRLLNRITLSSEHGGNGLRNTRPSKQRGALIYTYDYVNTCMYCWI